MVTDSRPLHFELEHLGVPTGDITSLTEIGGRQPFPAGREFTVPLPTTGTYAAVARRLDLDAIACIRRTRGGAGSSRRRREQGIERATWSPLISMASVQSPHRCCRRRQHVNTVRRELGPLGGYRGGGMHSTIRPRRHRASATNSSSGLAGTAGLRWSFPSATATSTSDSACLAAKSSRGRTWRPSGRPSRAAAHP